MLGFAIAAALAAAQQPNCQLPQTQSDFTFCSGKDFVSADTMLNQQWIATAAAVKKSDKGLDRTHDKRTGYYAALLDGQRAWIKFRDAHCVSVGYIARGGSMEPMLVNNCLEELTKARTKQLKILMEMYNN